ncbi:MAG TPA: hypothetical protein VHE83_07610 [Mycobacteriales bacterium]|nr:hypothetical protein [Mycobacteriales bacterium]
MPATTGPDEARLGWWQCRAVAADGTPAWLAVVWSERHPDGARVELAIDAATAAVGADAVAVATYAGPNVAFLTVSERGARGAPPLWFGEVPETTAAPPAVNLMVFTGLRAAPGALLDGPAMRTAGATTANQVGAVRWYPATGEVDQIYVQPAWRRHHVAGALIAAAAALSYARDWPRLWSDGQRTELGERLRNASPWRTRTADLTHLAPPMTPDESGGEGPPSEGARRQP